MGAGGIINQRARALLQAASDPSFYNSLNADDKAKVDAIDRKDPTALDQGDCNTLVQVLQTGVNS